MAIKQADILTPSQERFITEYLVDMSAISAYRRAGYKGNPEYAWRLLKMPKVKEEVARRSKLFDCSKEDSAKRRRDFWERVMNDESKDMRDRLKASELLGKAGGDFVERVRHEGAPFQLLIHQSVAPSNERE